MITKKPIELIFISCILRDGSGVKMITPEIQEKLQNDPYTKEYEIKRLSMSENTYIAHGFNSYVVKLKNV